MTETMLVLQNITLIALTIEMNNEKEPFVRNRNQKTEEAFNALESASKCLSEQEKSDAP